MMAKNRYPSRRLEELCEINIGKTPSRSKPAYWNGSHPWLSIADMNQGRYLRATKEKITDAGVDASGIKPVPMRTLVLSYKLSIGKVGITEKEMYTNEAIASLPIKDQRVLDLNYLYWALKTIDLMGTSDRAAMGNTLNKAKLKEIPVPLPALEEQKRIAKILDAADALRAKRRESLAQLDALLQSVFFDLFGDPLVNPKGYPVRSLSEFFINEKEGTKCGPFGSALKKSEIMAEGVPVWNMDNIGTSGIALMPFRMWVTQEKYEALSSYSVREGDVLISRAGTVGKMCVASEGCEPSIISTNLIRLRLSEGLSPHFFVSLMTYCKGRVGRLKTGPDGAFTHMNTGILSNLKFPYPPPDIQKRYELIVDEIGKQKNFLMSNFDTLHELFESLQQRAFSGEL